MLSYTSLVEVQLDFKDGKLSEREVLNIILDQLQSIALENDSEDE